MEISPTAANATGITSKIHHDCGRMVAANLTRRTKPIEANPSTGPAGVAPTNSDGVRSRCGIV